MKNVIVIYDDRKMPNRKIRTITGDKSYGETILKRVSLTERIRRMCDTVKSVCDFILLSESDDFWKINRELTNLGNGKKYSFFYMKSHFSIGDVSQFEVLLQKAAYADDIYLAMCADKVAACFLPDEKSLFENEEALFNDQVSGEKIDQNAFLDLSDLSTFLSYITGGFDARFFNSLEGDSYTVTKRSSKIDKIKSEYKFYGMLPDAMKKWFVMPYDYQETKEGASYTMERIHTTDIAIRFVHGAVSAEELSDILEQLFYFLTSRQEKKTNVSECDKVADEVYIGKVKSRMEDLKKQDAFEDFDRMIRMGTSYQGIDEVVSLYESLYKKKRKAAYSRSSHSPAADVLVISHGDLCFSNILYSRQAGLLKLIDPKGALSEDDLYMDPYYDIAKLSHSICGGYDFFNSGLYQVSLSGNLKWELSVDADLEPFKEVFYSYLDRFGYDREYVRVCEAGLFLSMLPFHMDQPGKVFGFLLNAIGILEELKD